MSGDIRLESIKAYKRMIRYFERQIAKLEGEIFSERCCQSKTRIYLYKAFILRWSLQC